ncbi:MAG: hypothetical protein ABI467_08945 [Kofleriaceae bacterium]
MRIAVTLAVALAVPLAACGEDHPSTPHPPDAAPIVPPDADPAFCDAPANSAHVSIVLGNVTTVFTVVHAGGTLSGGPVAPVTSTPMSVRLELVDDPHLSADLAYTCAQTGTGCPLEGIVGHVDSVGAGDELGPHPIMLESLQHGLTVEGTLTITNFVQPFEHAPGHISGSITTPDGSISGAFGNDFCALLLDVTI